MSREEGEAVRASVDIVQLIGECVPLSPKGQEYVGLCPFHDDHTPSLLSLLKNVFTSVLCVNQEVTR